MDYRSLQQIRKTRQRLLLTKEGIDNLKKRLDDVTSRRRMALQELQLIRDGEVDNYNVATQIQKLESIEEEAEVLAELLQCVEPVVKQESIKKVALGCTVGLKCTDKVVIYTIVCSVELDLKNNKISEDSLLGKAVLEKMVGDVFSIATPKGGVCFYEVVSIN